MRTCAERTKFGRTLTTRQLAILKAVCLKDSAYKFSLLQFHIFLFVYFFRPSNATLHSPFLVTGVKQAFPEHTQSKKMSDDENTPTQTEQETTEPEPEPAPAADAPKKKKKNPPLPTRSTAKSPSLDGSHIKGQDLKRRVKNSKFTEAIHKRGSQELSGIKIEEEKPVLGPFALAILIFVVCGSGALVVVIVWFAV